MIPKVIYKTGPILNQTIKKINDDLEKQNPGWKVKFYDDKACINFFKNDFQNNNPFFKRNVIIGYNKLVPPAYKADLWRLCVIYQYGGVYIDATSHFYLPIDKIFDLNKNFNIALDRKPGRGREAEGLQISLFAGSKDHPFLKSYICQILINIKNKYYGNNSLCPTGPICAWKVANKKQFLNKINIPVRLRIIGNRARGLLGGDGGEYQMIKSGIIVGVRKSAQHDKLIKKNEDNFYGYLWKKKQIYY